ncbi:MAG: hypothetical protein WC993_01655 [Methanoculleus sp.]|nr:hypothetical protein [Methanomicrobiales archaeon]
MLTDLSTEQKRIAVSITLLVFLIYCGFGISVFPPLKLHEVIEFALWSGAIGFQVTGIWYLLSRIDRLFREELMPATCYPGDDILYTAMKRILYNSEHFVVFITAFLSPFIIIELINIEIGNINLVSWLRPEIGYLGVFYDVFHYGVTFANYVLLGTILWILFSAVSVFREIKYTRYGICDIVDIYCPDRVGGLSPAKKYLFSILYVFLVSVTLLLVSHISILSVLPAASDQGLSLYRYFRTIAWFCTLSIFSFLGVILTVIGLNRLCSICVKKIEERIMGINERYRIFQEKLFSMSPDEPGMSEGEINNLRSVIEIYSNEREKLLRWHSECSGINVGTAVKIFVAYIPPLVAIVFQVLQLLHYQPT